jgi:hypothetical protein
MQTLTVSRSHIWDVIWPIVLLWIVLITTAFLTGAHAPEGDKLDFFLLATIGTFDYLLATLMLRRMQGWDILTIALSLVFLAKGSLWFLFTGFRLWPEFAADHADFLLWGLRLGLVSTLAFAFTILLLTPGGYAEQRRKEGYDKGFRDAGGLHEGEAYDGTVRAYDAIVQSYERNQDNGNETQEQQQHDDDSRADDDDASSRGYRATAHGGIGSPAPVPGVNEP